MRFEFVIRSGKEAGRTVPLVSGQTITIGRLKGCDLVVLSACDTQRGVQTGDTTFSLPLGFFFAGAPTVIASLWKVDDTATALLMTRFYENLLGNPSPTRQRGSPTPMSKADALSEAKHWLRSLTADQVRELVRNLPNASAAAPAGNAAALTDRESRGTERARPVPSTAPAAHPYEHPYYWAAFILIGDPQ